MKEFLGYVKTFLNCLRNFPEVLRAEVRENYVWRALAVAEAVSAGQKVTPRMVRQWRRAECLYVIAGYRSLSVEELRGFRERRESFYGKEHHKQRERGECPIFYAKRFSS